MECNTCFEPIRFFDYYAHGGCHGKKHPMHLNCAKQLYITGRFTHCFCGFEIDPSSFTTYRFWKDRIVREIHMIFCDSMLSGMLHIAILGVEIGAKMLITGSEERLLAVVGLIGGCAFTWLALITITHMGGGWPVHFTLGLMGAAASIPFTLSSQLSGQLFIAAHLGLPITAIAGAIGRQLSLPGVWNTDAKESLPNL